MSTESNTPILYSVQPKNPAAHLFEVTCTVQNPAAEGQTFSLPAWIPGSYMIRDFAKNIVQIDAWAGNQAVELTKLDKQNWQCSPCNGPLSLRYDVYAWDLSVRSAHLDQLHGFFNGTSLFLLPHGKETVPCIVDIRPPEKPVRGNWRVATTLPRKTAVPYQFGSYQAQNYHELIDHPVEMGDFTLATFEAGGVPHDIVITGRHHADTNRLCRDLEPICEQHIRFFGELPAMERYLFLITVTGDGYGGLEHRSSTALLCSRNDLPRRKTDEIDDGYRSFLGLCSHEYFHLWNIKRIKPSVFSPCDLSRENHTRQLWAFEGITSYYDDLALRRSGLISEQSYLELLGQTITRVLRGSGRFKQSVAESSFDAWTKFYRQDENAPNAIVSYYTKGALIALALDLTIRLHSDNSKSLDDVMKTLWERHGKTATGVPEGAIEKLAETIAGIELDGFFSNYLYGTEDLPLDQLLPRFGIKYTLRPADSDSDKGGKPSQYKRPRIVLGAKFSNRNGAACISTVFDNGAAQQAGLAAGDLICAIDNLRVTHANLEQQINNYAVGDTVTVHAFRHDELLRFEVTLQSAPPDSCVLTLMEEVDSATRRRRTSWLGERHRPIRGILTRMVSNPHQN